MFRSRGRRFIEGSSWVALNIRQAYNYSHSLDTCAEHAPMGYALKEEISNMPSQP